MRDTEKEAPSVPDRLADHWTLSDIAGFLGVPINTARVYNARAAANRKKSIAKAGDPPKPDKIFGRSPVWRPSTIVARHEQDRPGKGVGGGRPFAPHTE